MVILTNKEREILKKFENGGDIETKEEWDVLTKYGMTGCVTFGFLSKRARLTDMGRYILKYY